MANKNHQTISEESSFPEMVAPFISKLVSPQQLTDAYLLGICLKHDLQLLTFDLKIRTIPIPKEKVLVEYLM